MRICLKKPTKLNTAFGVPPRACPAVDGFTAVQNTSQAMRFLSCFQSPTINGSAASQRQQRAEPEARPNRFPTALRQSWTLSHASRTDVSGTRRRIRPGEAGPPPERLSPPSPVLALVCLLPVLEPRPLYTVIADQINNTHLTKRAFLLRSMQQQEPPPHRHQPIRRQYSDNGVSP